MSLFLSMMRRYCRYCFLVVIASLNTSVFVSVVSAATRHALAGGSPNSGARCCWASCGLARSRRMRIQSTLSSTRMELGTGVIGWFYGEGGERALR